MNFPGHARAHLLRELGHHIGLVAFQRQYLRRRVGRLRERRGIKRGRKRIQRVARASGRIFVEHVEQERGNQAHDGRVKRQRDAPGQADVGIHVHQVQPVQAYRQADKGSQNANGRGKGPG